jgi:biotin carboxyl carrier protein
MTYAITSDHLSASLESTLASTDASMDSVNNATTITLSNGQSFMFETSSEASAGASAGASLTGSVFYLVQDGKRTPIVATLDGRNGVKLSLNGYTYALDVQSERDQYFQRLLKDTATATSGVIKVAAPMPGLLKSIIAQNGQAVKKGERLFILEAMKMENDIKSPTDGTVSGLVASAGTAVEKGFLLCTIEPRK